MVDASTDPRRFETHAGHFGRGPNDPLPDPEEEARIKAEKNRKNEQELEEYKRQEAEQHAKREEEWANSWTKRVLTKGTGKQCFPGAFIRVHVTGRARIDPSFVSQRAKDTGFQNNSVFEDSRARQVPNMVLVGRGLMAPGLEKALLSMHAGERAEIVIQPVGGYGIAGSVSNPVVPGSATLTYDVEVLTVETEEELWDLSFAQKMQLAEERRKRGNALVGAKFYREADEEYEQGMRYLIFNPHPTENEAMQLGPAILAMHLNLSATKLRLGRETEAIKHCQDALKMSPDDPKAHYRLGQAYIQLGKYDKARHHLGKAEVAAQGDTGYLKSIHAELERLQKRQDRHTRERKRAMAKMGQASGEPTDNSLYARFKRQLGVPEKQPLTLKTIGLTEGWFWGIAMMLMFAGLGLMVIQTRQRVLEGDARNEMAHQEL